ncbi:hypothetical protein ACL02S_00950 [Nocardia sp. 004]|uniref:hypothetical protein n=1 Tax=Nocardia sp. 004 TaxID=3385978 RepID=UPI00399F828D
MRAVWERIHLPEVFVLHRNAPLSELSRLRLASKKLGNTDGGGLEHTDAARATAPGPQQNPRWSLPQLVPIRHMAAQVDYRRFGHKSLY